MFPCLYRSSRQRFLLGACALLLGGALRGSAAEPDTFTYQVKIGFLYNLARFAEWPPVALKAEEPIRFAIAGDDATYALISDTLAGRKIKDRPLVIERWKGTGGPAPHILYLTRTVPEAALAECAQLATLPVLTIGEHEGFARQHGMLNFVLVDEAVRFEVNLAAAQRAGLRFSSRVSKMAILVKD